MPKKTKIISTQIFYSRYCTSCHFMWRVENKDIITCPKCGDIKEVRKGE